MQIPGEMVDKLDHGGSNAKKVCKNVAVFLGRSVKRISLISDAVTFTVSTF